MNWKRRNFITRALSLLGVGALPMAAAKPDPPVGLMVECTFDYEGQHYGLAVPLTENMKVLPEEQYSQLPRIKLDVNQLELAVNALTDLAWSRLESLQMLKQGTYPEGPKGIDQILEHVAKRGRLNVQEMPPRSVY